MGLGDFPEVQESEEKKNTKPKYESKDGFEKVKVYRGFTEISRLFDLLPTDNSFVCGGYVRYMCAPVMNPVPAGDVDIYSVNEDAYKQVLNVLEKQMGLYVKHENAVSHTFKNITDPQHPLFGSPTIQLIKPVKEGAVVAVGDMETILANFDFTVIRIGLLSDKFAIADADFIHDETKKLLRLKNVHCPLSSTLRCMKYAKKGYWLPTSQVLNLFIDWDNRDDEYKIKLMNFMAKNELTQKEIDELEALLRID